MTRPLRFFRFNLFHFNFFHFNPQTNSGAPHGFPAHLLALIAGLAAAGCELQPLVTGSTGSTDSTGETTSAGGGGSGGATSSGGGGTGGSAGTGGTGGTMVCTPGATETCYEGPAGTAGVGVCKAGKRTCLADASGFGGCDGQVLPADDDACNTILDDDCDGAINEPEAGCACIPGNTQSCYEGPDGTAGLGQVVPAEETCNTSGDDDCDGQPNEGGPGCACLPGEIVDCYSGPPATLGVGPCQGGKQACNDQGTGFGPCVGESLPSAETCATPIDDDCDGQLNESGAGCVCLPDAMVPCYSGPAGTATVGVCQAGLALCNDQGTALGACLGEVVPKPETCNTPVDDDCDAATNEEGTGCVCLPGTTSSCYSGPAGTQNVGACQPGSRTCNSEGTAWGGCAGEVVPQTEACGNGGDDDCDGAIDEGCTVTYAGDARPIFFAKCGPCHTGGGSGAHNIGVSYSDSQLLSYSCPGKNKGQCAVARIMNGSMPGSPAVTAAEQAILQAWLDGGMLP
jgi:hypothetical protein